jgi:hypothetical protein
VVSKPCGCQKKYITDPEPNDLQELFRYEALKMIYRSKNGRTSKTLETLDWLTQLVTQISNKGSALNWMPLNTLYSSSY